MIRLIGVILCTGLLAIVFRPDPPGLTALSGHYPEELPGAFTSGFGEETCHSCHFDYPLNPEKGALTMEGLPGQYQSGERYEFTVSIKRSDLGGAGFQLSSRFEDGTQAGSFKINSNRIRFTDAKNNTQYLQHSLKGSKTHNQDSTQWNISWTAPSDSTGGKIIFNLAANAGNGDASAFGDYIYVREIEVESKKK